MSEKPRNTVPVRLTVKVVFDTESEARSAGEALKVDDDEFVETFIDGRTLKAEVTAETIESTRRAADDWLACLIAIRKSEEDQ